MNLINTSMKNFHYIYKITNKLNNKFYIGMHSTSNLDDGYFGSGRRLKASVNYHGKHNHSKEILHYCSSREELIQLEQNIVTVEMLNDPLCLNLGVGGQGGNLNKWTPESKKLLSESLKKRKNTWGNKVSKANKGRRLQTDEAIKRAADSRRGENNGSWKNVDVAAILALRKSGKTILEIANAVNISQSTVKRKLAENKV